MIAIASLHWPVGGAGSHNLSDWRTARARRLQQQQQQRAKQTHRSTGGAAGHAYALMILGGPQALEWWRGQGEAAAAATMPQAFSYMLCEVR